MPTYLTEQLDDALSAAEQELVNVAEQDLEDAGITIPDEDTDDEIIETATVEIETAPEPVAPVKFRKDNYVECKGVGGDRGLVGKVVSVKKDIVVLHDGEGEFTVDRADVLKKISAAEANSTPSVEVLETPQPEVIDIPAETVKVKPSSNGADLGSKKAQAIAIYYAANSSGPVKRAVVLKRLIEEVGLSKPGASTYYANIKLAKEGWTA